MVHLETHQSNRRNSAVIAGISLIIMAVAAFFSWGFVHERLVIPGEAGATYTNIQSSTVLFIGEIVGWVIILITDILVTWAFYEFLKPIHKSMALLSAWLRLVYTAILAIAVSNLILVLLLSTNTVDFTSFTIDQLQSIMMLFLEAFEAIWFLGLIVFGGHLFVVGVIVFRSDIVPRTIGVLLLLASVGYTVVHMGHLFFSRYDGVIEVLNYVFMAPMIGGELGFGIWLLLRGARNEGSVGK